eukprot:3354713-Pyramimonas_sp.AAC.1
MNADGHVMCDVLVNSLNLAGIGCAADIELKPSLVDFTGVILPGVEYSHTVRNPRSLHLEP